MTSKKCPRCGEVKEAHEFAKDKSTRSGLKCYCKACCHVLSGYETWVVKERLPEGYKRCTKCMEIKERSEFGMRKERNGGLRPKCKQCDRDRPNSSRDKDPQAYWAKMAIQHHVSRGDVVLITSSELAEMAKKTMNCPICGCLLNYNRKEKRGPLPNSPSWDRKFNGSRLTPSNTWIICFRCNAIKQDLPFPEFVEYCRNVVEKFGRDGL